VNTDRISTKRFLGFLFIATAIFSAVAGSFGFYVSRTLSSNQMGSEVMFDGAKRWAIVAGTMACLGIYMLTSGRKMNNNGPRPA
jgi:hypothetical protein